ncbi:MAG: hypothetical protein ACRDEB_01750 [Chitinophagaceae bacterium]
MFSAIIPVFSQDNSPYSRYGIGDLTPTSNIIGRSMGGISAGYTDVIAINFNNPASYSSFQTYYEAKSRKLTSGRVVLDVGLDFESRSLREAAPAKKFVAGNALFSYLQLGMPLNKNWGLSFGLRPLSRVSYKISKNEILKDPITGLPIDSAITLYSGTGGAYLVSFGSGFNLFSKLRANNKMEEKLSVGFNAGYVFGEKDYSTKRSFINDSVEYYQANFETQTNFHNLYLNAGVQYKLPLDSSKRISLTVGAFGKLGQQLNASQDILRETFFVDDNLGQVRLDSIYDQRNIKGKIYLPASFTIGFVAQKPIIIEKDRKEGGWMFGMDFTMQNWSKYRFYGQADSVKNSWEIRIGGQINPIPKRNYFSNVTYRAGLFMGPDYINVGQKLSRFGGSFGMGLPVAVSRQAPNQFTLINVAFEYSKRGNNNNILRENMFRFSLGFSLSDLWFGKRKYD